ncbi:Hypothetical predicted protein [Cloeon dipterum]|uniref:PARP catalytic domain-containing protein n=1 Tax=Cloeon dipterum TaxID=197152 RepID=A0A8S1D2M5_9INSE|nr:Hypothetical predicted protein [Cloeon dipterum]
MLQQKGFSMKLLQPGDKEYAFVLAKVEGAFKIKKLYKITNDALLKDYQEAKKTLNMSDLREMDLFHGSPWAKIIAKEGFRRGRVYFSNKASFSDSYARKNGGIEFTMLLCKVMHFIDTYYPYYVLSAREYYIENEKMAYPSYLIEY